MTTTNDSPRELSTNNDEVTAKTQSNSRVYDLYHSNDIWDLIQDTNEDFVKEQISLHIKKLMVKHKIDAYELVILYDEEKPIDSFHSNNIYNSISKLNKNKDILMFLLSDGGKIEPAYLISKTCKRLCKNKFVVTIPRRAKSAATLIALGANEIHMGLLSELGPIDPQINGLPALGLTNALEKITQLSAKYPKSSDMFAKYLTENLKMNELGYFERINESVLQYAQRLLEGKRFNNDETAQSLANHFTNHYKDHSFVIDSEEAIKYLSADVVKEETNEYKFGDELYSFLNWISILFSVLHDKEMRYIGSISEGFKLMPKSS